LKTAHECPEPMRPSDETTEGCIHTQIEPTSKVPTRSAVAAMYGCP